MRFSRTIRDERGSFSSKGAGIAITSIAVVASAAGFGLGRNNTGGAVASPTTTTSVAPVTTTTIPSVTTTTIPGTFVKPDLTNTGFTSALNAPTSGNITTATNGQVISNVDLTGNIGVLTNNVTITNCRIHGQIYIGRAASGGGGDTGVTGTHITHCTFIGQGKLGAIEAINGANDVFQANDISGYENCITSWGGNVRLETNVQILSNYCHGEASSNASPHYDGFEIYGMAGGGLVQGNNIVLTVSPSAAPINITPTGSFDSSTLTVDHNWATSVNCGYDILGDDSQGTTPIHASITNNRLTTSTPSTFCGNPAQAFFFALKNANGGSTYTLSGNVDDATGIAITQPSCRRATGIVANCFTG